MDMAQGKSGAPPAATAPVPVADVPLAAVVKTAVVTDSAAALPPDWVSAFTSDGRLAVVPMPVMVGSEIYGEGEDDITQTLSLALASGASVKTSRPSPGQFEQAYLAAERHGFEAVVSIHISSELSGTADAARLAAARVRIPVEVVDSRTVGDGSRHGCPECSGGSSRWPRSGRSPRLC